MDNQILIILLEKMEIMGIMICPEILALFNLFQVILILTFLIIKQKFILLTKHLYLVHNLCPLKLIKVLYTILLQHDLLIVF